MNKRIKVLFLTDNLAGGGAEKILVNLVNNMNREKFDIKIQTIFSGGVNLEKLSKDIKYDCNNLKPFKGVSRLFSLLPSKFLYNRVIGKASYEIVIAYLQGVATKILFGAPKVTKKIAWIHTGDMENINLFKCFSSKKAAIKAMKSYDAIVGVAQSVTDNFSKFTGITNNLYTCYNTNEVDKILTLAKEKVVIPCLKKPIICTVGRFTKEKGFSRLIDISYRLNKEGIYHSLMILGDGILKNELQNKVANMCYNDVYFMGYQKNPYAYMSKSDLFVCSSFYEGLSTATTEAVILGLPCVSTNVSGATEVLTPESQGIVVDNNSEALYNGIKQMLINISSNKIDKAKIKASADKFSIKNTVNVVENLLISVKEK